MSQCVKSVYLDSTALQLSFNTLPKEELCHLPCYIASSSTNICRTYVSKRVCVCGIRLHSLPIGHLQYFDDCVSRSMNEIVKKKQEINTLYSVTDGGAMLYLLRIHRSRF